VADRRSFGGLAGMKEDFSQSGELQITANMKGDAGRVPVAGANSALLRGR